MKIINSKIQKEKRKELRRNQTFEEKRLWKLIRGNKMGMKWRRQVSIGAYIADFYCYEKRLVIELDGVQHLRTKAIEYDKIRAEFFKSRGIDVIRITNKELMETVSLSTRVERVVRQLAERVRFA